MKKTVSIVALSVMLLCSSLPLIEAGQRRPSLDVPLIVTIEGSANIPGTNKIVGDGRDYIDGVEGVYAKFQVDNGTYDFIMDPTDRSVAAPRALYFQFDDLIDDGDIANPWANGLMTKIDTYLNFDEVFREITTATGGGFGQLFAGSKKINYRVAFNPYPSAINYSIVNSPYLTSSLEVSRPDCNTWIITPKAANWPDPNIGPGSGAIAGLIGIGNPTRSAGQYNMPFKMTLKRKTELTCP